MFYDFKNYLLTSSFKLIGITGNAGAGKSFLSNKLAEDTNFSHYSADYKFIGDSNFRKTLLKTKAHLSLASYVDACNQFNWWDWEAIGQDIDNLKKGNLVVIKDFYDRASGNIENKNLEIPSNPKVIYEGAILGDTKILNLLDGIIFVYTDKEKRLARLFAKDLGKRSMNEILARFLITEYSENKHYQMLFAYYKSKMIVVNEEYKIVSNFELDKEQQYLPILV